MHDDRAMDSEEPAYVDAPKELTTGTHILRSFSFVSFIQDILFAGYLRESAL